DCRRSEARVVRRGTPTIPDGGTARVDRDRAIAAERLGAWLRIAARLAEESRDCIALGAIQLIRDGHHRAEVERAHDARARHVPQRVNAWRSAVGRPLVTCGTAALIDRLSGFLGKGGCR